MPENTPRDFQAPEILAALQRLSADLAATRAEVRSLAARQAPGAAAAGTRPLTSGMQALQARIAGTEPAAADTAAIGKEAEAAAAQEQKFAQATRTTGGSLNNDFIARLKEGKVSLSEFGSEMGNTMLKFGGWTLAAGGVYAALGALKEFYTGAKDAEAGVDQLKRSLTNVNADQAQSGFITTARDLNVGINQVAEAQFYAARGFQNQAESLVVARAALMAYKLDMVDTKDAVRAFTTLHVQFGIGADGVTDVLNRLDAAQQKLAARMQVTLPALERVAPAFAAHGGSVQEATDFVVAAARASGQSAQTIGTQVLRMPSFVTQPKNQEVLKSLGLDPQEAETHIDEFMKHLIERAKQLGPQQQIELARALGGGARGMQIWTAMFNQPDLFLKQVPAVTRGAGDSAAEDLRNKLNQVDEILKSIPNALQQIGAELARSGAFDIFGAMLISVRDLLQDVERLVHLFNELPAPLRTGLSLALELGAAYKVLRATGLAGTIGGVLGGGLIGPGATRAASAGAADAGAAAAERNAAAQNAAAAAAERNAVAQNEGAVAAERNALAQTVGGGGAAAGGLRGAAGIAGQGLMRGLLYGLIAQSVSDAVGNAVGGSAGRTISQYSGSLALGAGAGGAIAGPYGALIGAVAGPATQAIAQAAAPGEDPKGGEIARRDLATYTKKVADNWSTLPRLSTDQLQSYQTMAQNFADMPELSKQQRDHMQALADAFKAMLGKRGGVATGEATDAGQPFAGYAGVGAKDYGKNVLEPLMRGVDVGLGGQKGLNDLATGFANAAYRWSSFTKNADDMQAIADGEQKLVDAVKAQAEKMLNAGKLTPAAFATALGATRSQLENATRASRTTLSQDQRSLAEAQAHGAPQAGGAGGAADMAAYQQRVDALRARVETDRKNLDNTEKVVRDAEMKAAQPLYDAFTKAVDTTVGLENAQTQDKSVQLRNTLEGDNEKLRAALLAFGRNSDQYRQALTQVFKDQADIVNQAMTTMQAKSALGASAIQTPGAEGDLARQQTLLDGPNGLRRQLAYLKAHNGDPNAVAKLQTDINNTQRELAQQNQQLATSQRDANLQLREAGVLDPVTKAKMEYRNALADESGLTGVALTQQRARAAQAKSTLQQAGVDEDLKQLQFEHDINQLSDNAYISALQEIIRTKKLSNDQKRQLREQIYNLQNQHAGTDLNIGDIKVPTLYEVRRAVAGGSSLGGQVTINHSPTVNVQVKTAADLAQVGDVLDQTLGTAIGAARSRGSV